MKKRILFCLAALGAASMLFGFDSAETADSVIEKMQNTSIDYEGVAMDMDVNVDLALEIGDGTTNSTIAVAASGGFDIAANMDPLALSMDGSLDVSTFGVAQSMIMKMYGVTDENGNFNTYVYTEDSASGEGNWEVGSQATSGINLEELRESSSQINFSDWGFDFELAPAAVDVDGTECYLLTAVMDIDSIKSLMEKSSEMTGEDISSDENFQMVLSMLNGIMLKVEYYVDTTTYAPVKFHMDLNDSDLSAISQYVAMAMGEMGEGSTFNIVLNDISVDATMTYGDANDITIPEEALAAAAVEY